MHTSETKQSNNGNSIGSTVGRGSCSHAWLGVRYWARFCACCPDSHSYPQHNSQPLPRPEAPPRRPRRVRSRAISSSVSSVDAYSRSGRNAPGLHSDRNYRSQARTPAGPDTCRSCSAPHASPFRPSAHSPLSTLVFGCSGVMVLAPYCRQWTRRPLALSPIRPFSLSLVSRCLHVTPVRL